MAGHLDIPGSTGLDSWQTPGLGRFCCRSPARIDRKHQETMVFFPDVWYCCHGPAGFRCADVPNRQLWKNSWRVRWANSNSAPKNCVTGSLSSQQGKDWQQMWGCLTNKDIGLVDQPCYGDISRWYIRIYIYNIYIYILCMIIYIYRYNIDMIRVCPIIRELHPIHGHFWWTPWWSTIDFLGNYYPYFQTNPYGISKANNLTLFKKGMGNWVWWVSSIAVFTTAKLVCSYQEGDPEPSIQAISSKYYHPIPPRISTCWPDWLVFL